MKIELQITDETLSNKDIKDLTDKINSKNISKICVLPCHVAAFKKSLSNEILLSTMVDFPMGILSIENRKSIIEKAITNKINSIELICPSYLIVNKNYTALKNEAININATCKENNISLSYIIEYRAYTYDSIYRICKNLISANVKSVYLSTGYRIDDIFDHLIAFSMIRKKIPEITIIPNANIFNSSHKEIIKNSNIETVRLKSLEAVSLFLNNS